MNKLIIIACLLLGACAETKYIVKPEVVYVDKPVYVSPKPPQVKRPELLIKTLTDADKKDPGKVVMYYHADIEQLLGTIAVYEIIIDQYKKANVNTEELQKQIDALYQNNKEKIEK